MNASIRFLQTMLRSRGASIGAPEADGAVAAAAKPLGVPVFTMTGNDESALALHAKAMLEWHSRRLDASFNSVEFREEPPRLASFQQPRMTGPGF